MQWWRWCCQLFIHTLRVGNSKFAFSCHEFYAYIFFRYFDSEQPFFLLVLQCYPAEPAHHSVNLSSFCTRWPAYHLGHKITDQAFLWLWLSVLHTINMGIFSSSMGFSASLQGSSWPGKDENVVSIVVLWIAPIELSIQSTSKRLFSLHPLQEKKRTTLTSLDCSTFRMGSEPMRMTFIVTPIEMRVWQCQNYVSTVYHLKNV